MCLEVYLILGLVICSADVVMDEKRHSCTSWWPATRLTSLYTINSPIYASTWFPCNDKPDDKAYYEIEIVVDSNRNAWIATSNGVSCISYQSMTLEKKAAFYEEEIEKYHRRTRFGYVNPAKISLPGDKSTAIATCTDNDGQRIGFYLAAMSLGYAATGKEQYKQDAHKAFEALVFLTTVTPLCCTT